MKRPKLVFSDRSRFVKRLSDCLKITKQKRIIVPVTIEATAKLANCSARGIATLKIGKTFSTVKSSTVNLKVKCNTCVLTTAKKVLRYLTNSALISLTSVRGLLLLSTCTLLI